MRARAGIAAGLGVAALLVGAAPAGAVECGDTITADTKLHKNLECGAGVDGITISGSGTKLDLNGHTISGPQGTNTHGVYIVGPTGAKVVDGTIEGFGNGVSAQSASDFTLRGVVVRAALGDNVTVSDVDGASITDNVLRNPGAEDNLDADGTSHEIEVRDNKLFGGRLNFDSGSEFVAIANRIEDSGSDGISVGNALGTLLRENRVEGSEGGAIALGATSMMTTVQGNFVDGGGFGGIQVGSGAQQVKVIRNTVKRTAFNGIFVGSTTDVVLRKNVSKRATGGDGIHVEDTDTLIVKNRVIRNAQHGIESFSANGSGNIAKHNGIHPQCDPESLCV